MEIWKAVRNWEGFYEVSSSGRVRSMERTVRARDGFRISPSRILSAQVKRRTGYSTVQLSAGPRQQTASVHRLVAGAFLIQDAMAQVVRHLDGIKTNNAATNLAWGTYAENEADKVVHGTRKVGSKHHMSVLTEATVREVKRLLAAGTPHLEISRRLPIKRSNVWFIAKGLTWSHVQDH